MISFTENTMVGLKVTVEQGELLGYACTTKEGFRYNSYCGIPYSKPPVGNLRFRVRKTINISYNFI